MGKEFREVLKNDYVSQINKWQRTVEAKDKVHGT